jgi:hypothetical protein
VRLGPEGLDRINVQNNPVNWIDPYGLQDKRPSTPKIRRAWEKHFGKKWPKDPRTGWNQDAHHKKPFSEGGGHNPENIEPKTRQDHVKHHKDQGDYQRWGKKRKPPIIPRPPKIGPWIFFIDFWSMCGSSPNDPICQQLLGPSLGGCSRPEA